MNEKLKVLTDLVPKAPTYYIDWEKIENSVLDTFIEKLMETPQDKAFHKEGSVWDHTKMVCEELVKLSEYRDLPEKQQQILFISALLHDIGKAYTTKVKNGKVIAPNHAQKGAAIIREYLYQSLGLNGNKDLIEFRETICNLIKNQSKPIDILELDNPERELLKISANQRLLPNFSTKLLSLLEEANIKGRSYKDKQESINSIRHFRDLAKNLNSYDKHLVFPDSYSEFKYLNGEPIKPGQKVNDDTWGEIILLSGLPASGKDTWISNFDDSYPVISLDDIRRKYDISPRGKQDKVVALAKEQAKEYLRNKQPFIWNATNLSPKIRNSQLDLFHNHNASTKIVYLETDFDELQNRNNKREGVERVPQKAINQMLQRLEPPESFEAESVVWQPS